MAKKEPEKKKSLTFTSGARTSVTYSKVIPATMEMQKALYPPPNGEDWDQTERFNAERDRLLTENPRAIISFKAAGLDRMPASVQPDMCFDRCDITTVSWDLVPKEVMAQLDFSKAVVETRLNMAAFLPQGFGRG